jgi:glycosyltransferase involved in cell wall biosynthesis
MHFVKYPPKLSVIMPVYNAEKYVKKAIESIINQTFQNWELLVCDDGSSDNSWEILSAYDGKDRRIKIFKNEMNCGKVKTVNSFLKTIESEYLTIHDADDWSEKERFQIQLDYLDGNSEYIGCGTQYFSHRKKSKKGTSNLNVDYKDIKYGLLTKSQIHGPTLIFRTNALNTLKVIYRNYFEDYNEDYDLCVRIAQLGKLTNHPSVLYNYRQLENSLSKKHSIKRVCSDQIIRHLTKQRFEKGYDDLDEGDLSYLNGIIEKKEKDYRIDKTLALREEAEILFHNGFFKKSIITTIKGIIANPLIFSNYRLLQYILRNKFVKN